MKNKIKFEDEIHLLRTMVEMDYLTTESLKWVINRFGDKIYELEVKR